MKPIYVLDSSALLAIFFGEARKPEIQGALARGGTPIISAVSLAEVVMTSARRNPKNHTAVLKSLAEMEAEVIPVDAEAAHACAEAKVSFPVLNFGDTFCYALAKSRGLPILTLDADFAETDAALVPLNASAG